MGKGKLKKTLLYLSESSYFIKEGKDYSLCNLHNQCRDKCLNIRHSEGGATNVVELISSRSGVLVGFWYLSTSGGGVILLSIDSKYSSHQLPAKRTFAKETQDWQGYTVEYNLELQCVTLDLNNKCSLTASTFMFVVWDSTVVFQFVLEYLQRAIPE